MELSTAQQVIEALGGYKAVAKLTSRTYQAVHNWKQFGDFPANFYAVMQTALREKGCTAPASLWRQEGIQQ